jgi:hypothetical protein
MQNEKTRPTPQYDEARFRDIGERLVRSTDPAEQSRLKTELVLMILRDQVSRQQGGIRALAPLAEAPQRRAS